MQAEMQAAPLGGVRVRGGRSPLLHQRAGWLQDRYELVPEGDERKGGGGSLLAPSDDEGFPLYLVVHNATAWVDVTATTQAAPPPLFLTLCTSDGDEYGASGGALSACGYALLAAGCCGLLLLVCRRGSLCDSGAQPRRGPELEMQTVQHGWPSATAAYPGAAHPGAAAYPGCTPVAQVLQYKPRFQKL
mmetsp:Transcript_43762/g.145808  ORF Transcript_43762/g.145808 Transcript_43762/m.145808 type:complete len:189 (-) Transcript_43762:158-724(-)